MRLEKIKRDFFMGRRKLRQKNSSSKLGDSLSKQEERRSRYSKLD